LRLSKCANLMLSIVALQGSAFAGERLSMTVRILDQADVTPGEIRNMERYVEMTLAAIDLNVKWIDCVADIDACKALRGRNEFWLRILAQNPPDLTIGKELLGLTQRGDKPGEIPCVNIFYPLVEKLAEKMHIDAPLIFGAGVAHEIGHMYLGTIPEAHSHFGIMCGIWSHREFELLSIGELNFTREEGERIRAAISTAIIGKPSR
jgi:hypothetical protein